MNKPLLYVITCLALSLVVGSSFAQITFTGDLDADFLGKPGVIMSATSPGSITDAPLSTFLPD